MINVIFYIGKTNYFYRKFTLKVSFDIINKTYRSIKTNNKIAIEQPKNKAIFAM